MTDQNKVIDYNTKVSKENFDLLERQRLNKEQSNREMVNSRFVSGTLSGLQERLRVSMTTEERNALKSIYKDKKAKDSGAALDSNFKSDGIGRMTDIGYSIDNI